MGRLDGKVALITGAARGTGESTARLFVEEGARVVVADILDEPGTAVAADLGDAAHFAHLDVTSPDDWARAVAACVDRFGGLDALVNNAAILHMAALVDTEAADFERLYRVNTIGPFLGIKAAVPPMRAAGRGSIVNISSIDGLMGHNGICAYAASKWAVRGLTRVAALELGKWGIRVNAVCPEAGGPDMIRPYLPPGLDLEPIMARQQAYLATQHTRTIAERVGDVARLVAFLASDEGASCTGGDFPIEGGLSAGRIHRGVPGD